MNNSVTKSGGLLFAALFFVLPFFSFAFQGAPVAQSEMATFVTEKSARVNGKATPNEVPDTRFWFEWGISGRFDVYETERRGISGGNNPSDVNEQIVGLAPNTQYFFRLIVESARGKSVGSTMYFTTKELPQESAQIAIVQTLSPAFLEENRVTLRGYVSPHGNQETRWWFQWGTTQQLEYETPRQGKGREAGTVETAIKNLAPGTTHFYRVVAENTTGRTMGATRVFVTRGVAPAQEALRDQYVSVPVSSSADNTPRTTTTAPSGTAGGEGNGLPGTQAGRPGDFFSNLFGRRSSTGAEGQTATSGGGQVAGAGTVSGPLGSFWNTLTGKRTVEVAIEKVGPQKVGAHTPVEYKVGYVYRLESPGRDAVLKITLPGEVVYIGDTTNNELLVEDSPGGAERTYVLPLGTIQNGASRSISILGMTTSEAEGFPEARARLEYTDGSGAHVIAAQVANANKQTATAVSSGWSILPNSFFDWMIYIALVIGGIFGIRRLREYYVKRKEKLAEEEKEEEGFRKDRDILDRLMPKSE